MRKILLAVAGLCFVSLVLATTPEDNMIDIQDKSPSEAAEKLLEGSGHDLITSIYRKAIAKALNDKVTDLQTKLIRGENAVPAAIEILKYALFSNQAKASIRKFTEHVLSVMSPEMRKQAVENEVPDEPTTPMAKIESDTNIISS